MQRLHKHNLVRNFETNGIDVLHFHVFDIGAERLQLGNGLQISGGTQRTSNLQSSVSRGMAGNLSLQIGSQKSVGVEVMVATQETASWHAQRNGSSRSADIRGQV